MDITTKFHGEIKIKEKDIFIFETGIPGFDDEKKFVLLPMKGVPFLVLQSLGNKEIAFVLTSPFEIYKNYEVKLSEEMIEELHIGSEEDVSVFVILTVKDPFNQTTVNLQAPIVLNVNDRRGKQFIMNNSTYSIRQLLIQSPEQGEK